MEGQLSARAATIYNENSESKTQHQANLVELKLDGEPTYFIQDLGNPSVYHRVYCGDIEEVEARMDKTKAQPYEFLDIEGDYCEISPQIIMDTIFRDQDLSRGSHLLINLVRAIEDKGLKGLED